MYEYRYRGQRAYFPRSSIQPRYTGKVKAMKTKKPKEEKLDTFRSVAKRYNHEANNILKEEHVSGEDKYRAKLIYFNSLEATGEITPRMRDYLIRMMDIGYNAAQNLNPIVGYTQLPTYTVNNPYLDMNQYQETVLHQVPKVQHVQPQVLLQQPHYPGPIYLDPNRYPPRTKPFPGRPNKPYKTN